jgi:rod shape-determining protein MreC
VRLKQDADQARRLQALLDFKEKFISKTVAAQVIGTSGTEQSRVIIVDKGARDGIKPDMAVITPDGIVGKVKDVFPLSSQVLLINDHDSGAGVILEHSRLQGIVKGTSLGELQVTDIMSDEQIEAGDHVITSGGDRIYPKGFSVGTVVSATPDRDNDPFLAIKIKPSADLRRLEEVLVVTKTVEESGPVATGSVPLRAADILAQRLPSVPKQDPNAPKTPGGASPGSNPTGTVPTGSTPTGAPKATPSPTPGQANQPVNSGTAQKAAGVTGPAKQSPAATSGGSAATATSSAAKKASGDAAKPAGQTGTAAGTSGAATVSPTPAKPKAAPKKAPAATPGSPGATEPAAPKASDQPATQPPAAMPTPTPERRQ